jgi:hypothetical protein
MRWLHEGIRTLLCGYCLDGVLKEGNFGDWPGQDNIEDCELDGSIACNVCGKDADFVVQLELVWDRSNYSLMNSLNQMPFYLCKAHEYIYERMQNNIELTEYFRETVNANR